MLYACDFFAVETLGMFGTIVVMVFFVTTWTILLRVELWSSEGQTADEMYFGCGATVPDELAEKGREAQR